MTEEDKGDVRCRGWWGVSGDFVLFWVEDLLFHWCLRIDLLPWRRLLLFVDVFPGLVFTSYPGFYFQNAGVVRRNAALRIPLIFCIPSICFNHCLASCFHTMYKLSNSLMGY
jgi:hypothetical protein